MRLNFPMTLVSLIAAGLVFYGFYKWNDPENFIYSVGSAVMAFIMLLSATAISLQTPRSSVMFKTTSAVFFTLMLVADICLAAFNFSDTTFIITNGAAICLWLIIIYGVAKAKQ